MAFSKPFVSIITPVLNREEIVHSTIESIIEQKFQDWEHIIVDDKSEDDTESIVNKFAEKDSRIKLFRNETKVSGANRCRNIGMKAANGEYLIFIDSDDQFADHCLEKRVEYLSSRSDLDFAVFPCLRFKEDLFDLNILLSSYKGDDVLPLFLKKDIPWGTLNPIYRKEKLFSKNIFWNEKISIYQDIEFHIKTICRGLTFNIVDERPDCFWREHGNKNRNTNDKVECNLQSNYHLLDSLYLELTKSNRLNKDYITLLIRFFLVESLRESISIDKYDDFSNLADSLRQKQLINTLLFNLLMLVKRISILSIRKKAFIIIYKMLRKIYGKNNVKYFLTERYDAKKK